MTFVVQAFCPVSTNITEFVLWAGFAHNFGISETAKTREKKRIRLGPGAPASQPTDLRLGHIVKLLMEHATVVVSGTKIAEEILSHRSEVWRLIQQLRSMGVDVAGHPATGYQLRSVPDLLLPEILRPLVHGTIFKSHLHHFYKIGSTNTAGMAAAAEGAPEGSVFLAEEQTAGRGRGANSWQSPRSTGIYCSLVLKPALPPSDVLALSLAAGLAVQTAIQEVDSRVQVDLKWPNATSLRLVTGSEWSRVELVAALLKSLDREYRQLADDPDAKEEILQRFAENSSWVLGKRVRIEENGSAFEGTTEGLDPRGFLQVRTPHGVQTVLSGTVREW